MRDVLEVAWLEHRQACRLWEGPRMRGVARPFGRPDDMPEHRWRVSWDVMQRLTEAYAVWFGENPKTSTGTTKLLFGWPLVVDRYVAPGTLLLERADVPFDLGQQVMTRA